LKNFKQKSDKLLSYIFYDKTENQFYNSLIAIILYSCNKFAYILSFYKNIKNENHNQE